MAAVDYQSSIDHGDYNTQQDVELNVIHRKSVDLSSSSSLKFDNKQFLFDSVCTNFHFQVFVEQLLCHLILPIAPFFLNLKAQGFAILHYGAILFNYIVPFSVYIMIISYTCSSDKNLGVLVGALWVPLLFFVQHRMTVALKYASLSVTEYQKFQHCQDFGTAWRYISQMELLRNWSSRDVELIEFELGCASVRTATKLNEIFFVIYNPDNDDSSWNAMINWNSFITGSTSAPPVANNDSGDKTSPDWDSSFFRKPDGSFCVSVHDVCTYIVLRSDCPPRFLHCLNIGGICIVALVTVFPFIQIAQHPVDSSHWVVVFLVFSTFLNILMGMVYVFLLTIVIKDAVRHVNVVQFLHSLIRLTDLRLQIHVTLWSPWFARNSLQTIQVQEEAIAKKNYELIRSLTVRYSPEEVFLKTLDVHFMDTKAADRQSEFLRSSSARGSNSGVVPFSKSSFSTNVGSARNKEPSASSSFSSKSSEMITFTSSASLPRPPVSRLLLMKKKSTIVGEFMAASDTLEVDARPSTILPPEPDEVMSSIRVPLLDPPNDRNKSSILLNASNDNKKKIGTEFRKNRNIHTPLDLESFQKSNSSSKKTNQINHEKAGVLLENAYSKLPRIDMNLPENVSAWITCRLALQNFGERFRMRTEIYTLGHSLVIVGFMASVLVLVLTSSNRRQVFASVFIIQACLLISLSFVYVIILASIYALSNAELAQHQHTLSSHTIRMRNEIAQMQELKHRWMEEKEALESSEVIENDSDDEEEAAKQHGLEQRELLSVRVESISLSISQVHEALEGIEASLDVAVLNTELRQLKLYGFNADSSLVISIATTATSFFIVVLGLYSKSVANAGLL